MLTCILLTESGSAASRRVHLGLGEEGSCEADSWEGAVWYRRVKDTGAGET